jgi:uncharacterized OsmC-like protein
VTAEAASEVRLIRARASPPTDAPRLTHQGHETSRDVPTLRYEVEAHTTEPGVSIATTRDARLSLDSSAGLSDSLFGPADLLAAALAACILKNVERFSGMLPFRYRGARVNVVAERGEAPPRIVRLSYLLDIWTDEPPHRVDLLHRNIAKFGTIYKTLAPTCEITGEIAAHPVGERDHPPTDDHPTEAA